MMVDSPNSVSDIGFYTVLHLEWPKNELSQGAVGGEV